MLTLVSGLSVSVTMSTPPGRVRGLASMLIAVLVLVLGSRLRLRVRGFRLGSRFRVRVKG